MNGFEYILTKQISWAEKTMLDWLVVKLPKVDFL